MDKGVLTESESLTTMTSSQLNQKMKYGLLKLNSFRQNWWIRLIYLNEKGV